MSNLLDHKRYRERDDPGLYPAAGATRPALWAVLQRLPCPTLVVRRGACADADGSSGAGGAGTLSGGGREHRCTIVGTARVGQLLKCAVTRHTHPYGGSPWQRKKATVCLWCIVMWLPSTKRNSIAGTMKSTFLNGWQSQAS